MCALVLAPYQKDKFLWILYSKHFQSIRNLLVKLISMPSSELTNNLKYKIILKNLQGTIDENPLFRA